MVIIFDSIDYENLGRMIYSKGWTEYFITGPNREPIYPTIISVAMRVGSFFSLPYLTILVYIQISILFLSQLLLFYVLKKLKTNPWIIAGIILYFGISPALVNSAFSLYSEIATYPWILSTIILTSTALKPIERTLPKIALTGALTGICFLMLTSVKGIFELITPIYLLLFILFSLSFRGQFKKKFLHLLVFILFAILTFYSPLISYKFANKTYNGQYTLTSRGAWALYGNTARRAEPLSFKDYLSAFAYAPGKGVCHKFFDENSCQYWSFTKSDEFGFGMNRKLTEEGLSGDELNSALIKLSIKKASEHPFQYALLMGIESLKMFFWESTKIGFVNYPPWLTKIYDFSIFKDSLRLVLSILSFFSLNFSIILLWRKRKLLTTNFEVETFYILLSAIIVIIPYIGIHAIFYILTRYALVISPLFLILIAFMLQQITKKAP